MVLHMSNDKMDLCTALGSIGDSLAGAAHDLELRAHLHAWHPISTAPGNQNLEVEILSNGERFAIPFPCRKLNSGEWINADLGLRVQINPKRWRAWSYSAPAVDHRTQVAPDDHTALVHTHGTIARQSAVEND
jgi:hypothetical protein